MDLSQVRYFNAVARHGSFSAAAKALGVTQPGLTKAVRRLEASLDCTLFVRMPRGVVLTQQGQALLRHASLLDVQLQDARKEVRALTGGAVGELRIGAGPSWLSRAMPRIVAELTTEYPGLSFHVVGGYNGILMEALSSGDLDLVVSALPDQSPAGLEAIPLTTDTISIVARRSHPLRTKRRPQPSSTLGYPWVLPGRDVLLRSRLEALFRVAGLEPPPAKIETELDLLHCRGSAQQRHALVRDVTGSAQRDGRRRAAPNSGSDHDPIRGHPVSLHGRDHAGDTRFHRGDQEARAGAWYELKYIL